jgi:hypothetical protein
MSPPINAPCSCGCSPCACPSPAGFGCTSDKCVPRPCFFHGQLVTSDDLNAIVTYFRTRDAMLARLVSGWGVLAGMRVDAAPGIPRAPLATDIPTGFTPNPQIVAGTTIQVHPGAAIDAAGRMLANCSPCILDLARLMAEAPTAPKTRACEDWFAPLENITGCGTTPRADVTAMEYWLVAEYVETPSRPVPQYSGGGACDPAPTCDFSRKLEGVRFRLVPSLPSTYLLTGCLDAIQVPGNLFDEGGGEETSREACVYKRLARFEAMAQVMAQSCCAQPVVVLARVLITSSPGTLQGALRDVPLYAILIDDYPLRRIIVPSAMQGIVLANLMCTDEETRGDTGGPS